MVCCRFGREDAVEYSAEGEVIERRKKWSFGFLAKRRDCIENWGLEVFGEGGCWEYSTL